MEPLGAVFNNHTTLPAVSGNSILAEPEMRLLSGVHHPDPQWTLIEEGFTLAREHEVESLFSIGNGYVGNRGSLAEGSPLSAPATFVAGVFSEDRPSSPQGQGPPPGQSEPAASAVGNWKPGAASVPGLFLLPDWTGVRAWVEGTALNMMQGEILEHYRLLDMKRGMLFRKWRHRDPNSRITRIDASRLASLAERHLLIQQVLLVPENYSGQVVLESSIELAPEVPACPPSEEYKARRSAMRPNILPLALRSPGRDITVAFGAASQLVAAPGHDPGRREIEITDRRITERFTVPVIAGAEYQLFRVIAIYTSRDTGSVGTAASVSTAEGGCATSTSAGTAAAGCDSGATRDWRKETDPIDAAVNEVNRILPDGVPRAIQFHQEKWKSVWERADIQIEGDDFLQHALRFAEYHLISAANPEDPNVSIGARALTGESYKGHVFWDTEIYMLPFYTFCDPAAARALLSYRHHTLPAARAKAKASGYRGAMYPWESADTGEETTPRFVIDPGGHVIEVLNGDMENHITADVAFAIWQYWKMTEDDDFLLESGAEIMLETARFWASRGALENDNRFHIRHVIGPDEYHENVDDSAFTNLMASWNLTRGAGTARWLQANWPQRWKELAADLQFIPDEVAGWLQLANSMYRPFDPRTGLFEQHRGYYELEPIDLAAYEPRHTAMDVILGHEHIQQTNVVKQADVVMAMYLLWDEFSPEVRAANFRYYEPRTGHGSSLSPSIHALMAARMNDRAKAEQYLKQAAEIDLGNNMGNASGGIHAAAVGGLWQAMIFGFGGLYAREGGLRLDPHLLPHWKKLAFPLQWHGSQLQVTIDRERIRVLVREGNAIKLSVGDEPEIVVRPLEEYSAAYKFDWR
jgi:trehalose/maltose hydrolase-like predicted phosphorylase